MLRVTGAMGAFQAAMRGARHPMLKTRLISVIVILPVLVVMIALGGLPFAVFAAAVLAVAAWEFWRMFHQAGYSPSMVILTGGTFILVLLRYFDAFNDSGIALALLALAAMAYHTIAYQRGAEQSAVDFCLTLGGLIYLGWIGAFFVSLRQLPDGEWWTLLILPAMGIADAGAYAIGRRLGKHKMMLRVSPNKSWEGYVGGIITAVLLTPLIALFWHVMAPAITIERAALAGFIVALVAPMGDFGESMLKRQFNVKDTSNLIPGHGGIMDRLDSMLWAAVIGYLIIIWFF
jgi:phosphatidate cytidylyltransferase